MKKTNVIDFAKAKAKYTEGELAQLTTQLWERSEAKAVQKSKDQLAMERRNANERVKNSYRIGR